MWSLPRKEKKPLQKTPEQVKEERLDSFLRILAKVEGVGVLFERLEEMSESLILQMDSNAGKPEVVAVLAATLVQNKKLLALLSRHRLRK